MKRIIYIMTLLLLLAGPVYAKAADEPTPIYDLEGLLSMAQNPAGSYILMDDIDLAGVAWAPIDFTGSFDGNGHCLLNLTVTSLTKETRKVIDGNRKPYQAKFAGFFGIIEEATVKNLTILGANVSFEYDDNAFLGILCGYTLNSTIENCHVQGFVSLTTSTIMYGVAGLCGYGTNYYKGCIKGCSADVRLVTIDTDLKTKDEQFLAGIVCIGYSKIWDCTVKIDGYISDHGYVHSGGITGMFIKDTDEQVIQGSITGNKVTGRIRFFEDNTNRRAYCGGIIGEKFTRVAEMKDNDDSGFVRDEIFTYDKNIMPHDTCLSPAVTKEVVPATRSEFGYTLESCSSCGFQTKSDFTIYVEPPTATPTPLPTATPEPTFTPTPTVAPTSTPLPTQAVEAKDKNSTGGVIAVCLLAASAVVILTFFIRSRKTSK